MNNQLITDLFKSGAHFGHKTYLCNPKMKHFVFKNINKINIIDLYQTAYLLKTASIRLNDLLNEKKKILFVGTKKSIRDYTKDIAINLNQFFINHKWIGGLLTNWNSIKNLLSSYKELKSYFISNEFSFLSKKELILKKRQFNKLDNLLNGIELMETLPSALFIIDAYKERNAILEANKLGIKIFAIIDTNSNPDNINYLIPANDDSKKTISFILEFLLDNYKKTLYE